MNQNIFVEEPTSAREFQDGGLWPGGPEAKGDSLQVEASTNSPAEERFPEKAAEEMEKIGFICSEKGREEAVAKASLTQN